MRSRIGSFFRSLLRKGAVEQALDDELQSAVELLTQEKMKEGLSHPEARRQALIELGGVEQVKEEVRAIRPGMFLETFAQDLRYTFRELRKRPTFALTAILSLALGIAATSAVFSVVYAVLVDPFPYPGSDRIMELSMRDSAGKDRYAGLNGPQMQQLRQTKSIESIAGMDQWNLTTTDGDLP